VQSLPPARGPSTSSGYETNNLLALEVLDRFVTASLSKPAAIPPAASDAELVRAFLNGNAGAFAKLVARYQQIVHRVVRRYASPEDANDLTQRVFLTALEKAHSRVDFKPWVLRVAINLGKNHARRTRRWREEGVEKVHRLAVAPSAPRLLERAEQERRVRQAVLQLPRRQREVLTLRVDAELPFAEIAATLGIQENTAKVQFHFAVKRLTQVLASKEDES
jgi:RNA polymerase sigma-70 factor, ECF subfamily